MSVDNEMVEKYTEVSVNEYKDSLVDIDDIDILREAIAEAYIAGLKAGRPQWHDLRKDPNDLPKDKDEKLCLYEKGKVIARYDSEYNCWETYFNGFETVIPSSVIIAWCELPQFTDKE